MTSIYDSGPDYDTLTVGHNIGSEADFYASLVPPGGKILELACGTGRLIVPLAGREFTVTGLDNSEAMLKAAEAKAALQNVSPAFLLGDMREFNLDT